MFLALPPPQTLDPQVSSNLFSKIHTKGQTKSKEFFRADVFFQKTNERIRLYCYDTSGLLVFVRFLEDTTKTFRN